MHIEIVDSLRCPSPHEETWLVASVTRFEGRDIVEGALGCPVCRRQFAVRHGEVDFTGPEADAVDAGGRARATPVGADLGGAPPDEEELLRARALLALADGGGLVLLGGEHARMAAVFEDEAQVMPLLLNAPAWASGGVRPPSAIRIADGLPVAAGALRAAWLDEATASRAATVRAVVRALRTGGRLVAPVTAPLPDGARELARDAREWVAESSGAASAPVSLRRR